MTSSINVDQWKNESCLGKASYIVATPPKLSKNTLSIIRSAT